MMSLMLRVTMALMLDVLLYKKCSLVYQGHMKKLTWLLYQLLIQVNCATCNMCRWVFSDSMKYLYVWTPAVI